MFSHVFVPNSNFQRLLGQIRERNRKQERFVEHGVQCLLFRFSLGSLFLVTFGKQGAKRVYFRRGPPKQVALAFLHFHIWIGVSIRIHSHKFRTPYDLYHQTFLVIIVLEGEQDLSSTFSLTVVLVNLQVRIYHYSMGPKGKPKIIPVAAFPSTR